MELRDRIAEGWSRIPLGWSRIEQKLWTGPVVQDYGPISESRGRVFTRRVSVLLTEKEGTRRLFVRESGRVPLAVNSLLELDREAAHKLLEALEDALPQLFAEE